MSAERPERKRRAGLSYDIDGSAVGSLPPKSFTYDPENRPLSITDNGVTTSFTYDPEGERASKTTGSATTTYLGNDVERLSVGSCRLRAARTSC